MDSTLPPVPVDGAGGALEPHAAAKSVIRIQKPRIRPMIVRLSGVGMCRLDSCIGRGIMRAVRTVAFFCLLGAVSAMSQRVVAEAGLSSRVYASGLSSPVAFIQDSTSSSRQFVVEQGGRIRVVENGTVLGTDFLNLTGAITSGGERGLLGMALAPDYATSRSEER